MNRSRINACQQPFMAVWIKNRSKYFDIFVIHKGIDGLWLRFYVDWLGIVLKKVNRLVMGLDTMNKKSCTGVVQMTLKTKKGSGWFSLTPWFCKCRGTESNRPHGDFQSIFCLSLAFLLFHNTFDNSISYLYSGSQGNFGKPCFSP